MSRHNGGRVRIGIIGTGWWSTQAHLPSLVHYPDADVVAIADLSAERLRRAAATATFGRCSTRRSSTA